MNKVRKCPGKEGFQRLNYLYQISDLLQRDNETHQIASIMFSNLMVNISKKTVQRLDIPMKRTICKMCRTIQLAGITSRVRIKKKRIIWTCLKCHNSKVFPTYKNEYSTWTHKQESLVETLDYTPDMEKNEQIEN